MIIVAFIFMSLVSSQITAQYPRPMMGMGGYRQPPSYGMSMPMGLTPENEDEPDSGNWYEKLRWWKEAKRVYSDDVHDAMEQVRSLAASFDQQKKELYSQLDAYYASIPVARDAAVGIINGYLDELKKELEGLPQAKEAQLKKEEREKIALLEGQTKTLDGLKETFEQLNTMVNRLHEAYDEVYVQQIRECDSYDERAHESYQRIEKVLDDEKAHYYYDLVENSLENIRAIIQYLRGPFSQFIGQAWAKIQELMPKIQTTIADLDKQGIAVRVLTEKEKAEREALKKKKEEERMRSEEAKKAEAARQAMPWWKKIFYSIGSFFASIGRAVKWPISWIGSLFVRSAGQPQSAHAKKEAKPGEIKSDGKAGEATKKSEPTLAPSATATPRSISPDKKEHIPAQPALPLEIQKSLLI